MKKFNFVTEFIQGRVRILDYYNIHFPKKQGNFEIFSNFLGFV